MASPPDFSLQESQSRDGASTLAVGGTLDISTAPRLEQEIERLSTTSHDVVLDLSGVSFMDSSGLSVLISATRRAAAGNWSFGLRGQLSEQVSSLLGLTRTMQHLPFVDR